MLGVVRHWNGCYGKLAVNRRLVFFHRDDLVDVLELTVGTWVEFDPVEDVRGPRAARVRSYSDRAEAEQ